MYKYLLFLVFLFINVIYCSNLESLYDKQYRNFNSIQKNIMKEIYSRTKEYNIQYLAMAIAWQESNLGLWNVNLQDPSCGPFHQNIKTYVRRYKIKDTSFNRNKICSELLYDMDMSVSSFLAEIEAWKSVHRNKNNDIFKYVIKSYNAGYNYNIPKAEKYYEQVSARIKILKKYYK